MTNKFIYIARINCPQNDAPPMAFKQLTFQSMVSGAAHNVLQVTVNVLLVRFQVKSGSENQGGYSLTSVARTPRLMSYDRRRIPAIRLIHDECRKSMTVQHGVFGYGGSNDVAVFFVT